MSRNDQTLDAVLEAIRRDFPRLSPQLQLGARFLIDHPEEVAVSSMRQIAGWIGIQPATLVRLAQSLGFSGWPELRARFVDHVRRAPTSFSRRAADLVRRRQGSTLFQDAFGALMASVEKTGAGIPDDAIQRAAALLENAATVYVAGFRSCFAPAFTFYYTYRLFRPDTVVLLSGTGGMFEGELRALGPDDVVLLTSFDPYSREAGVVAGVARTAGARLIAVTDSSVAPTARDAEQRLLFSTGSSSFFPSVVAASALLECLVAVLLSRSGRAAVAGVRDAEAQLYALGAYLLPPRSHAARGRRSSNSAIKGSQS